jgi:hypothetical protein
MKRSFAAVILVGLIVALAGFAVAGHRSAGAIQASRAAVTAIHAAGGEWATPHRSSRKDAAWEFVVTRMDGSTASVRLNERLEVIDVRDRKAAAGRVDRGRVLSDDDRESEPADDDEDDVRDRDDAVDRDNVNERDDVHDRDGADDRDVAKDDDRDDGRDDD